MGLQVVLDRSAYLRSHSNCAQCLLLGDLRDGCVGLARLHSLTAQLAQSLENLSFLPVGR